MIPHLTRSMAPSAALLCMLFLSWASFPPPADASCNFVPGTVKEFQASIGSADRPFAAPGDPVFLGQGSTGCDIGPQAATSEVLLLFTPPAGPSNAVLLSEDCAGVPQARLDACSAQLPGFDGAVGTASCLPAEQLSVGATSATFRFPDTRALVASQNAEGDRVLSGPAKVVVTDAALPLPCGLANPASIPTRCGDLTAADLTAQGIQFCVDEFFRVDGTCRSDAELVDRAFGHFVALPAYNPFDTLCDTDGVCTGERDQVRFTTDVEGNLLAPIDWSGVLVRLDDGEGGVIPVPRLVTGESDVVAFADETPGQPIQIPGDSFIQSFSPQGHTLPPIFTAFADSSAFDAEFFGSVDAPLSVTRIKRRGEQFGACSNDALRPCNEAADCEGEGNCVAVGCYAAATLGARPEPVGGPDCTGDGDCSAAQQCGASLFEFRDRFEGEGCGPIEAAFSGTADNVVTVDNLFLPQTKDLLLIAHDEELEDQLGAQNLEGGKPASADADFNQDGNLAGDVSLTANARKSGQPLALGLGPVSAPLGAAGIAVPRILDPPFRFPAVAAEGPVVALLQFEATDFGQDFDGNGRVEDTLLRVYRLGSAGPINPTTPADADPVIGGRSLAVVDGLVFYRASEPGRAARSTVLASVDGAGNAGNQPSFDVGAISPDGRFVAFTSDATNLTADVYSAGVTHVFVHDRDPDGNGIFDEPGTTTTERVSEASDGTEANGSSGGGGVSITPDGRYVVYTSLATNLDPIDPNPTQSIYRFDRATGQVELVSRFFDPIDSAYLSFGGPASDPDISADGRLVVFSGRRLNLGDIEAAYLREIGTTLLEEISIEGSTLKQANATRISADGRFVAFQSSDDWASFERTGETDVFIRDRDATFSPLTAVSFDYTTFSRLAPPGAAVLPTVSDDGSRIAFLTEAAFVSEDTNGTWDAYVFDVETRTHLLASRSAAGCQSANPVLLRPALSPDGRFVAFAGDLDELETAEDCAPVASDGVPQLYVHDLVTRDTVVRSRGEDGLALATADLAFATEAPGLSRNALHASFATSEALVTGDANSVADTHLRGLETADAGADLDGDNVPDDLVLEVFDTLTDTAAPLGPATQVEVSAGGHAAFLCPADGGPDGPVCLYENRGGVTNLGRNATEVAISEEIVAALISESPTTVETHPVGAGGWSAAAGGTEAEFLCGATGSLVVFATAETTDVTGNGFANGRFVQVYDATSDTLTPLPWPTGFGPGLAAADSCVMGPEVRRCTGDTGVTCSDDSDCGGGWCDGTCQTLGAVCTGDGDCAGGGACREAALVAFESRELFAPGSFDSPSCDLNGDGGCDDRVLLVFDTLTGRVLNTGQAVVPCREEACDPRVLYLVGTDKVRFLTEECAQGTFPMNDAGSPGCFVPDFDGGLIPVNGVDLNRNGVSGELIVQEFDVRTGRVSVVSAASAGGGNPLGGESEQQLLLSEAGVCVERFDPAVACTSSETCAPGEFCSVQLGEAFGECVRDRGACVPCLDESGDCLESTCSGGLECISSRMIVAAGDFDGDGIPDPVGPPDPLTGRPTGGDNCPTVPNPEQIDTDGDGIGDACDGLTCGNGIREPGEECDDGDLIDDNACANDCTWNFIEIDIDIKVGSDTNPINLSSSIVPVAVLTTDAFDVASLVIDTLCFGPRPPDPTSLICLGDDTEMHGRGHFEDVDGDGDIDVQLHYDTAETNIVACSTEACISGQTVDGIPVLGCDTITTVPPCEEGDDDGVGDGRAGCGLGAELALVAPLLWWLSRRRRRA